MNQETEKLQQYQKLIQARNRFTIGFASLPVFVCLCYYILKIFIPIQGLVFVLTMIVGIFGYIFVMFGFLMKDICPWCKQHFFFQSNSSNSRLMKIHSFDLFFRKHCGHCNEPKQD
ncbi:hypothetical protein [Acinetobacter sp. P8-3-8]|uniref:hypothetical protein n=1 Tax=Acinetobacter sp. P8-3-8 TaxID=1029823 RepID=UPI0002488313|nr:hypothetical protein [Acinetobacter sp. P8-3-8]